MVREKNTIYYHDSEPKTREEKMSEKSKKALSTKAFYEAANKRRAKMGETPLEVPRKKLRELDQAEVPRPSALKRSLKKMSQGKLMLLILKHIVDCDDSYLTKEDVARKFKVKECSVEQVFQLLNIKGILSQRSPEYAHDTNRNPMFPMDVSGWCSDHYYIEDKDKAKDLLKEIEK